MRVPLVNLRLKTMLYIMEIRVGQTAVWQADHFAQTAIYQSPMEILISVFASGANRPKGIKLTGRFHNQIFSISYFTHIIR